MINRYFFAVQIVLAIAAIGVVYSFATNKPGEIDGSEGGDFDKGLAPPRPAVFTYKTDFPVMSDLPNIDVNPPGNSDIQGETSVAIDPANPNIVISGSNDYRGEHGAPNQYIYYSNDGGNTWNDQAMPACSSIYNSISDPSIAYDANGVAYFGYGAFNTSANGPSAVIVQRSLDGGSTWDNPTIVYPNTSNSFEDKYYVTADATPSSSYKNNVYISWTDFENYKTQSQTEEIYVARSTNEGASWQPPVNLNANIGYGHLSMPATGPNGEVYVLWSEVGLQTTQIEFASSMDGGATFSSPSYVQQVYSLPAILSWKNNLRMLTYPAAAVDNSNGANRGRIYVTWAALNTINGNPHIYLAYSDDKGNSWSTPEVVDNDPTTGNDKFHPWISCDPMNGAVAISYYDSQNDPANTKVDLYAAYSTNGAQSFHVNRVSSASSGINPIGGGNGQGGYWADYTGITAYKGKIIPCWTDQRSGNSIYNTDAYVSIIKLGPPPVSNLAAAVNIQNPTGVVLTWNDPTKTLGGDPLTSFDILVYRDSRYVATVASGVQTFTDGGLQTGSYHTYQLYVVAGADTSDFVSAAGYAGGNLVPLTPVLTYTDEQNNGTLIQWRNPSAHIDNTPFYDFSEVYLYLDGSLADSIRMTTQDTGKVITYIVDHNFTSALTLKKFHSFSVAAVGTRGGFVTSGARSDTMMWYAGAPNIALAEGFESNPVFGTNGTWTTTTVGAHTGTHCLVDNTQGKSKARQNTFAMLPPTIVQSAATQFSFWQIALVAQTDSAIAEFTTDNGSSWRQIGAYNINSGQFHDSIGNSVWQHVTYDMSSYVGDTVVFRFRLHTGSLPIQKRGWYIDDAALQSPNGVAEGPAVPSNDLLLTNYPNPFTSSTMIAVRGLQAGDPAAHVSLVISDAVGNIVADLSSALRARSGDIAIPFDAHALPAGTYYALLRAGTIEIRRQLALVK